MKTLDYKGLTGSIRWSEEHQCYTGKILNVEGCYSYEGKNLEELEKDFRIFVKDYLEDKKEYEEKQKAKLKQK